jgi:photosystem II stability/assembly factor-like uncharacterized protein
MQARLVSYDRMLVAPSSKILDFALGPALCAVLTLGCPGNEGEPEPSPVAVFSGLDLVAVDVIDGDHVVVVAATGEIHHSSNSGLSWQAARVPAVAGLRSISMADSETGWVVGHDVILRSEDGGASWRQQQFPDQVDRIRLVSVSAIDREHAIAVGESGTRLRTRDGGRSWHDISQLPSDPSERPARMGGVFCKPESSGRCWTIGADIRYTKDAGLSWQRIGVEDSPRIDPIVFRAGEVEVEDFEAVRLEQFVAANRYRKRLQWRIEPGISPAELEQIGRRFDPDALLEVVAARLQEVRSMIEEAGVSPDRIVATGAPPWDYEDYLDDDPDFLARYWRSRSTSKPSVRVRIADGSTYFSLRVRAGGGGLAVGEAGALLRSEDAEEYWRMADRLSPHDLLAVGIGRRRDVAVGTQGGIWLSQDDGETWGLPAAEELAPFFDTLRDIAFSPSGELGMIVGEQGRMLRSVDGGATWQLRVGSSF